MTHTLKARAVILDGTLVAGSNVRRAARPEEIYWEAAAILRALERHPTRKLSNFKREQLRRSRLTSHKTVGQYVIEFKEPLDGANYQVEIKP